MFLESFARVVQEVSGEPIDMSGSTIQNGASWSQAAATSTLFDLTRHVTSGSAVRSINSNSIEMHLRLGTSADLDELRLYGPSDAGMHEATSSSLDFTIYKAASGFGTGGTQVGQVTGVDASGNNTEIIIPVTFTGLKTTDYTILWAGGGAADKYAGCEIEANGII